MMRMRIEYPDAFAEFAHRAISNRRVQMLAFPVVVAVEAVACLVLLAGTCALVLSLFGVADAQTARAIAVYGATCFIAIWAGFLFVGNYFSDWFCHEATQNTYYQMTLWTIATLILLAQG